MNTKKTPQRYVAFLRGINVGGHHKLPMADLRAALETLEIKNTVTLLNSGNVIFDSIANDIESLEENISKKLEKTFGFSVPTLIRKSQTIHQLFTADPFRDIEVTKDIRLYVTFLRKETQSAIELPWISADNSYKIIEKRENAILSVLDLSVSKTPKAMKAFEEFFGKDITTRNWKTIERIIKKI